MSTKALRGGLCCNAGTPGDIGLEIWREAEPLDFKNTVQGQTIGRTIGGSTPETVYISFSAEIIPHTTEALIALISHQVNIGVINLHLLISTPGGSVMNGMNLYNFLRALPLELTTHNIGNVDSIGNAVFLAGA